MIVQHAQGDVVSYFVDWRQSQERELKEINQNLKQSMEAAERTAREAKEQAKSLYQQCIEMQQSNPRPK